MSKDNTQLEKLSAENLIGVADEILRQINMNEQTIYDRKLTSAATINISNDIVKLVNTLLKDLGDEAAPPADRIQKANDVLASLVTSLGNLAQTEREEIIRLEATQTGMKRVAETVKVTGENQLKLLEAPSPKKTEVQDKLIVDEVDWDDT
jgi:cell division protein ZapA (FtsZ GTPase activity inhibitor)